MVPTTVELTAALRERSTAVNWVALWELIEADQMVRCEVKGMVVQKAAQTAEKLADNLDWLDYSKAVYSVGYSVAHLGKMRAEQTAVQMAVLRDLLWAD